MIKLLNSWKQVKSLWYISAKMVILGFIFQLLPLCYEAEKKIWSDQDHHFGVKSVWQNPISHFRWQVAENNAINVIVPILESFRKEYAFFHQTFTNLFKNPQNSHKKYLT